MTFPEEHPDYDFAALHAQPSAPAPTLMPGPQLPSTPPPASEKAAAGAGRSLSAIAGVVAILIVVGIVVTVALSGHGNSGGSPLAKSGTDPGQGLVYSPPPAVTTAVAATSTPDPGPTDENSAHLALQNQVATDHTNVEALTERWVPQLSSKRPGLKANGITFDYRAIWSDFSSLQDRYPGALLLWSGDYSSFRLQDFWVTIAPLSFDTGQLANSWCDSAGLDRDNCFAKRITHTGSSADSTLPR